MPGEREVEEGVFFLSTSADVVDDERGAVFCFFVGDDHDVGEFASDGAGDEVAGEVVFFFLGEWE